ncbi:MAG: nucleotide-binding protein [Steroidobacter sp.]
MFWFPAPADSSTIMPAQAADHVGEYVTVVGRVASVYTSNKGNTFLNFGAAYPNQIFSGVIFVDYADRFRNVHGFEGHAIRISGVIKLYQGRPEIILERSSQLQ